MKRIFGLVFVLGVVLFLVLPLTEKAASADFDSDFDDASVMRGDEAMKGTDSLVKDTAMVLHNENKAILAEIAKLHNEIAQLKKEVQDIKDVVEE